ncbi:VOC family protein [Methylomarinum vadi]|uniref:VOC family protein n=1 Tax=Methylomarinum vadi TaxID=438855 RepID=UPI0004DF8A56|nr:VOC family protein [Methylomarinum vadi]
MPQSLIDHIVITAPTLETGTEFVREKLGVEPQNGGEHPAMGTHNMLLRLGEALYLEVIAVNPDSPAPGRPRWFGLDHWDCRTGSALSAWVVRVSDIQTTASAASESLGEIRPMRRADLNWLITIPADGVLPLNGVAPALIEWRTNELPAARLRDLGLSLLKLELFHPEPARVERLLATLELEGSFSVGKDERPHLRALIDTPLGVREL